MPLPTPSGTADLYVKDLNDWLSVGHNDDGTLKGGDGGTNFSVVTKTSNYTVTIADNVILADATTAAFVLTLPSAVSLPGQQIIVRKTDATNNHNVTITPAGSETINGVTGNFVLSRPGASTMLVSDGANWRRLVAPIAWNSQSVYYVDASSGNDSYTGRTPWDAFKTIGAAITACASGSTIWVAKGTYVETVDPSSRANLSLLAMTQQNNVIIQAPSDTTSALKFAANAGPYFIKGFQFQGGVGNSSTYTGIVCDMANFTIGSVMEDCTIYGINTDFDGSKIAIGKGVYGGTAMSFDRAEQANYRNITVNNAHVGLAFPGTGTFSKNMFEHLHLNQCFIIHQETNSGSWGDNSFANVKTQQVFGLSYAVAQLNSNGSNPADGDTVLVRNQTYRFKNTMVQANDVQIGAGIDATLLSLVKAVNGTGVVNTDYFSGTAQPTGVEGGWMNLVDYGAAGGNGFFVGAVDTTRHACSFRLTDTIGPDGNNFTFTVTSSNLSDYFGKGKFDRAAWAIEAYHTNQWMRVDAMENISLPAGNCILFGAGSSGALYLDDFVSAPQTKVVIKGNGNHFYRPRFQNDVIVQSGAIHTIFEFPFSNTETDHYSASRISDSGTGTIIRLGAVAAASPWAVTYSASMTPNVYNSDTNVITATNGTGFTINAPIYTSSNLVPGMKFTIVIRNTSGGALGTATWDTIYKMAAWTQPANGYNRTITFRYDGTNWIEISRTPADVPN